MSAQQEDKKLLEVKDLRVSFFTPAGEVKAVGGISYDLNYGEVMGVVGESGSGKSQEAYAIMGLLQSPGKVIGGSITFEGTDVLALSKALHDELRPRGIKVLAVCPGPMNTDFWTVANVPEGKSRLIDKLPRVDPKEVAEGSLRAAKRGKLVYTNSLFYKVYRLLAKLLPHGFLMEFTEI